MAADNECVFGSFYKQAYQIGGNVTNIIALPCVEGAMKIRNGSLVYLVNVVERMKGAVKGDWLCEDRWGNWHMVRQGFEDMQNEVNRDIVDASGYPAREMTKGEDTKGMMFSTESVRDDLEKKDDLETDERFYGYVEDRVLFASPKDEFERYILENF